MLPLLRNPWFCHSLPQFAACRLAYLTAANSISNQQVGIVQLLEGLLEVSRQLELQTTQSLLKWFRLFTNTTPGVHCPQCLAGRLSRYRAAPLRV